MADNLPHIELVSPHITLIFIGNEMKYKIVVSLMDAKDAFIFLGSDLDFFLVGLS